MVCYKYGNEISTRQIERKNKSCIDSIESKNKKNNMSFECYGEYLSMLIRAVNCKINT